MIRKQALAALSLVLVLLSQSGCCCCVPIPTRPVPDDGGNRGGEEGGGEGAATDLGGGPPAARRTTPLTDIRWQTFEQRASDVAEGAVIDGSLRVSPDGRRYAFAVSRAGEQAWIVDGKEAATFPKVSPKWFVFSGDSRHYLCAGHTGESFEKDPGFVLDGRPLDDKWTQGSLVNLWLSRDGSQYAFVMRDSSSCDHLVIDGEEIVTGHTPLEGSDYFVFSGFSEYLKVSSGGDTIRWAIANYEAVVVDGKLLAYGGLPNFTEVQFSDDGSSWAVVAEKDSESFLVVNDEPQKRFERVSLPALSADGEHWAHAVGEPAVVVDGKEFPVGKNPLWPIAFSPDGARWACCVVDKFALSAKNDNNVVVIDGKAGNSYATVGDVSISGDEHFPSITWNRGTVVFSADGVHVAYAAGVREENSESEDYGRWYRFMALNGEEGPCFGWVDGTPVFSPDGDRLAYWAGEEEDGPVSLVVDDEIVAGPFQKRLVTAEPDYFDDPNKARDNPDLGYPVLSFSPDSRSVGGVVRDDDEWKVVLDGGVRAGYDRVAPEDTRAGFTPDGSFTYLATKGGELVWVEERPDGMPRSPAFAATR